MNVSELFEQLNLEYIEDDKYILDCLLQKEVELIERLENIDDKERQEEIQSLLDAVEKIIPEYLKKRTPEATGITRIEDDLSILKNNGKKTDEEVFNEILGLLGTADYQRGIELLHKIADEGNEKAQFKLGSMYSSGNRVQKDSAKAIEYYGMAASLGNAVATNRIGVIYSELGDYVSAVQYYRKAADLGYGYGYYNLGNMYTNGKGGCPQNSAMALEYYIQASQVGLVEGMHKVGVAYAKGIGVLNDDKKAFEYFLNAAEKNYSPSMDWVAFLYENGRGTEKNLELAIEWYKKAIDNGEYSSELQLANLYFKKKEFENAFEYAIKAYNHKINGADKLLDKIDKSGYVLPHYVSLAEKGYVNQQIKLARAYSDGLHGVDADKKKAAEWCEKAANAGNAEAQYMLALMYKNGSGVKRDTTKSKKYLAMSIKAGSNNAKEYERKLLFRRKLLLILCSIAIIVIPMTLSKAYKKKVQQVKYIEDHTIYLNDMVSHIELSGIESNGLIFFSSPKVTFTNDAIANINKMVENEKIKESPINMLCRLVNCEIIDNSSVLISLNTEYIDGLRDSYPEWTIVIDSNNDAGEIVNIDCGIYKKQNGTYVLMEKADLISAGELDSVSGNNASADNPYKYLAYDAEATPSSDFAYEIKNGSVVITGYNGKSEEVVIPASIEGKSVISIGRNAFSKNNVIKRVIIREGVQRIEHGAFSFCDNLEGISCDSVKIIEDAAFMECGKLSNMSIDGVEQIGQSAFFNCDSLVNAVLPDGLETIALGSFQKCDNLEYVEIPSTVTLIDSNAFYQCRKLNKVLICEGNSEAKIGSKAFSGCNSLSGITIPGNYVSLGSECFWSCYELKYIEWETNSSFAEKKVGDSLLQACNSLTDVYWSKDVIEIEKQKNYGDSWDQVTIHTQAGTAADLFADEYGIKVIYDY